MQRSYFQVTSPSQVFGRHEFGGTLFNTLLCSVIISLSICFMAFFLLLFLLILESAAG